MASQTALANGSYSLLGIESLLSVTDSTSDEAVAFRGIYDITRKEVLRATSWRFAMRTAELAATLSTPAVGFTTAYQLPTNPECLQVVKTNLDCDEAWAIFGNELHSNRAPKINYVADVGIEEFDSTATSAIMYLIASRLAIPLKGSRTTSEMYYGMYKDILREARQSNAHERGQDDKSGQSLRAARLSY